MVRYGFNIKTEDNQFNTIYTGFDYCEMIEKLNNHLNACYYNWEIIKKWKM